jgi:hypothetical protein
VSDFSFQDGAAAAAVLTRTREREKEQEHTFFSCFFGIHLFTFFAFRKKQVS